MLSPRDFALARGWHEAGVPLATVLVAIDPAFERGPRAPPAWPSCRRRVEELAAADARGARRAGPRDRAGEPARGGGAARRAARAPRASCPGGAAALPLAELAEVSDLVAVASRPNWDYLRERLRRIDELVAGAAVEALLAEDAAALRAEAARAAERHRGKVDERALAEARGAPPAPARPRDAAPAAGVGID